MTHSANSGLAILNSPDYGRQHFVDIGRKGGLVGHGGRPRSLTLTEAISTRNGEGQTKKECAPNTARSLRSAWLRKVEELEMGV